VIQENAAPLTYRNYLLRFWREGTNGPWRISLLAGEEGVRRGFADLDHLVAYLQSQLEQLEAGVQDPDSG
jgi:hypothetical protein